MIQQSAKTSLSTRRYYAKNRLITIIIDTYSRRRNGVAPFACCDIDASTEETAIAVEELHRLVNDVRDRRYVPRDKAGRRIWRSRRCARHAVSYFTRTYSAF